MSPQSVATVSGERESRPTYLVSGTLSLDTLLLPSGTHHDVPGGSALFAALGASLVRDCTMVGTVGHDFPEDVFASLASLRIDVSGVSRREEPTFRWRARYSNDLSERKTLDREEGAGHEPPAVPGHLAGTKPCVLLGSMSPAHQHSLLAQAGAGARYGVDTMAHWVTEERRTLERLADGAAVIFASQDECTLLAQRADPLEAAQALVSSGDALVVLKMGAEGAYLVKQDAPPFRCPAVPSSIVDPTGAGDALAGAFLAASSLGLAPVEALARGVAAAAIALEGVGCSGFTAGRSTFDDRVGWALAQMKT